LTKAIVLAGSLNNGRLKECSPAPNEALIRIGNRHMIEYVVDALKEARRVHGIIISGPKELLKNFLREEDGLLLVESGPTIMRSLLNAVDVLDFSSSDRILVVTSDIPLITGPIIDSFLEKCLEEEADLIYPIVAKSLNQVKFPGVKRTYVKLLEGIYTGGNIFLVNPQIIKPCARKAAELVELRKKPLKLVNYIGFSYFLKYIFRSLSIKDAEGRVSELFNIKGKAIPVAYPEIGVDVDKPSDLELVEKILGNYGESSNLG